MVSLRGDPVFSVLWSKFFPFRIFSTVVLDVPTLGAVLSFDVRQTICLRTTN